MSSKILLNWFVVSWLLALGNLFRNNFLSVLFCKSIKQKHLSCKCQKKKKKKELEATMLCREKVSHCHEIKLN